MFSRRDVGLECIEAATLPLGAYPELPLSETKYPFGNKGYFVPKKSLFVQFRIGSAYLIKENKGV